MPSYYFLNDKTKPIEQVIPPEAINRFSIEAGRCLAGSVAGKNNGSA